MCLDGLRLWHRHGRWRIGQHALDDRRLLVGRLLRAACDTRGVFHLICQFVAGINVVQTWVVVLQALQLVVRCFQRFVGHQQHVDALLHFDLCDLGALLIQQK